MAFYSLLCRQPYNISILTYAIYVDYTQINSSMTLNSTSVFKSESVENVLLGGRNTWNYVWIHCMLHKWSTKRLIQKRQLRYQVVFLKNEKQARNLLMRSHLNHESHCSNGDSENDRWTFHLNHGVPIIAWLLSPFIIYPRCKHYLLLPERFVTGYGWLVLIQVWHEAEPLSQWKLSVKAILLCFHALLKIFVGCALYQHGCNMHFEISPTYFNSVVMVTRTISSTPDKFDLIGKFSMPLLLCPEAFRQHLIQCV